MSEYTPEQQSVIDEVKAAIRVDITERGIPFMEKLHREHGPEDKQGQAWWEFVETGRINIARTHECVAGQYITNVGLDWVRAQWWSPFIYAMMLGGLEGFAQFKAHGFDYRGWHEGQLLRVGLNFTHLYLLYNDAWREAITALRNAHTNA
jgi:hypothetical protein